MTGTYRWSLDEYVLRCEDGLFVEVLTEGGLDRDLLADVIVRWGVDGSTVMDADYVAVTQNDLDRMKLGSGVKAQLIAIALALEARACDSRVQARVAIVVDRDYGPPAPTSRFLLETDGHSMESYALNERTLDRFVSVGLGRAARPSGRGGGRKTGGHCSSGKELFDRLLVPAIEIAAVRLALAELELPIAPFDRWTRYVTTDSEGFMGLEGAVLLGRVLEQNSRGTDEVAIEERRQVLLAQVKGNPFRFVRGHDFVVILQKLLQSSWGRRIGGSMFQSWPEDKLSRFLLLAVPADLLDSMPMLQSLKAMLTTDRA